jgi:hypothetical protein
MINEQKAQVTVNLEASLRQLEADGHSKVWVDAICINQGDRQERSRQILRMRKSTPRPRWWWLGSGLERGTAS